MTRSLRTIVVTVVTGAATATLVWMPTLVLAGISFQAME